LANLHRVSSGNWADRFVGTTYDYQLENLEIWEKSNPMNTTIKVGVLTVLLLTAVSAQSATVNLVQDHGTYLVPVEINGAVKLPFMIDTGASSVMISKR
jgi:hypothetical protein